MKTTVTLSAILLIWGSIANAQWLHQESGGAFDDKPMQIAATPSGNYVFGLRCTGADDLQVIFLTPETSTSDEADNVDAMGPELLIRVDKNAAFELKTDAGEVKGEMGFFSATDRTLLEQVQVAKSRVAVAIRVAGKTFHEHEFGVSGSTKAMASLIEKCSIP